MREPEAQEALRALEPELQVVVAFGQILPRAVIDIAPRGTVNVHASLLPKLRGAAPIQWAIATGETETGVTTMLIDEGLDTGPLLLARSTRSAPRRRRRSSSLAWPVSAPRCCSRPCAASRAARSLPVPQDTRRATLAPILKKEDGRIDWSAPAARDRVPRPRLRALARGLHPARGPPAEGASACARRAGAAGDGGHDRGRVFGRRRRRLRRGHEPPARRGPAGEPPRHARVGLGGGRAPSPRRAAGLSVTASARAVALEILGRLASRAASPWPTPWPRPAPKRSTSATAASSTSSSSGRCGAAAGWITCFAASSSRPIDRLTPGVLDALRLGAYQLLYLRVAEHAAVSESVELARAAEPRSAGFANAVLRRLQREGPPPAPDPIADPLGWLTSAGSLPRWLAERWCDAARAGGRRSPARARSSTRPRRTSA